MEKFGIFVSNSTVTIFLGREFGNDEFYCIAKWGVNSIYDPKKFHAIIIRFRMQMEKHTTALVFRSGRVVLTGARSKQQCIRSFRKLLKIINNALVSKGGYRKISLCRFHIRNVVFAGKFPTKIFVEKIHREFCENFVSARKYLIKSCRYDPSIFPGIRIASKLHFTLIIFVSGNFIVTGLKDYEKWKSDVNLWELLKFLTTFERK